jgi:hypothetical protein
VQAGLFVMVKVVAVIGECGQGAEEYIFSFFSFLLTYSYFFLFSFYTPKYHYPGKYFFSEG